MKLENKSLIITGSSRGIGKEIALLLAKNGASVVINYTNNKTDAEAVKNTIEASGGTAITVQADVSKKDDVIRLFDSAIAAFGKIDVLINNAGVMKNKLFKDYSQDDFSIQFDVNVRGVFNTMQEATTKLADNGIILNFSSTTTKLMLPSYGIYSATKAAVEQMTRVVSKEIGRGISVNAIAPGPTRTELFLEGKSEEFIQKLNSMNAFGRLAEPMDIAKVVLFLVSDDSKWISGQVIGANGAMI